MGIRSGRTVAPRSAGDVDIWGIDGCATCPDGLWRSIRRGAGWMVQAVLLVRGKVMETDYALHFCHGPHGPHAHRPAPWRLDGLGTVTPADGGVDDAAHASLAHGGRPRTVRCGILAQVATGVDLRVWAGRVSRVVGALLAGRVVRSRPRGRKRVEGSEGMKPPLLRLLWFGRIRVVRCVR